MEILTIRRKGKYLKTLEKYHIYKVSREKTYILKHTIPYSKNYIKFTQNNITHPLPPPPPPPPFINTEASTLHMHNVCNTKTTPHAACGNNGQARGNVSISVNKQNITLTTSICGFSHITDCRQNITTSLHMGRVSTAM
jgi:hypothetical protein